MGDDLRLAPGVRICPKPDQTQVPAVPAIWCKLLRRLFKMVLNVFDCFSVPCAQCMQAQCCFFPAPPAASTKCSGCGSKVRILSGEGIHAEIPIWKKFVLRRSYSVAAVRAVIRLWQRAAGSVRPEFSRPDGIAAAAADAGCAFCRRHVHDAARFN